MTRKNNKPSKARLMPSKQFIERSGLNPVVAIDPGNKTGAAVWLDGKPEAYLAIQDEPRKVWAWIQAAVAPHPPSLVVIEKPIYICKTYNRAQGLVQVAAWGGYHLAKTEEIYPNTKIWRPTATEWRYIIGMGGRNREDVKAKALEHAREISGLPLTGPRGGALQDAADAVCMAEAGSLYWAWELVKDMKESESDDET